MSLTAFHSPHPGRSAVHPPAAPTGPELVDLARSRERPDRERLLKGIVALCEAADPISRTSSPHLLSDIFTTLVSQIESDLRRVLAEEISEAEWAPRALIDILVLDEIEIARPIIARSPLLRDQDLLRVLVECTLEHQIEVARRPRISTRVCDAILDNAEPVVMTALAGNRSADISEGGMRRLVEASRRIAALRGPLIRHPHLSEKLAAQLYACVGQALRQAISERFRIDTAQLDRAVEASMRTALRPREAARPTQIEDRERIEMEQRLVAKLDTSGQLRPGYLIRAVREGRLSLFEIALSTLGGFNLDDVRRALRDASAHKLALACASVGIDRAVFPALVQEIRRLNADLPGHEPFDLSASFALGSEASARAFREAATHVAA